MKLIAKSCIRSATGRSAFHSWRKDGSAVSRNLSREIVPGEAFELPDLEARALIKSGSAVQAETYGEDT